MRRIFAGGLWFFAGIFVPFAAGAQTRSSGIGGFDFGLDDLGRILALPDADPRVIAVRLINVALEFLAIIFLVLVLWSGFLFLVSGGKQEATARAVAVLRNAIIGLLIILSSWAIVRFVISSLVSATNGGMGTESSLSNPRLTSSTPDMPL